MRKRGWLLAGCLLLLAVGCTAKYVKFPIAEFLFQYLALRDEFRDDTYPARKRCAPEVRQQLIAAKVVQCESLQIKLEGWAARDRAVLLAIIQGGTVDLAALRETLGPLVKLAADIAL